jgi:phospholipid-translocating ATPase
MSELMGVVLLHRDQKRIVIRTPVREEVYEIVVDFPFTSERKRMGIVLKPVDWEGDGYIFYLKGADDVMKSKVPQV